MTYEVAYDYSEVIKGYNRREAVKSKAEPRFEELSVGEITAMVKEMDEITANIFCEAYEYATGYCVK